MYLSSHSRAGFSRTIIKACVLLLVLLHKCELYTLQTPHPAGVEVHWDGLVSVHILLPPGVHTCGLCGDNDGNPSNDMVARYVKRFNDQLCKRLTSPITNGYLFWWPL